MAVRFLDKLAMTRLYEGGTTEVISSFIKQIASFALAMTRHYEGVKRLK